MKKLLCPLWLLAAGIASLVMVPCQAQFTLSFNVPAGTVIPDTGTSETVLESISSTSASSVDQITVSISHEWLGDLTVEVRAPSGETFTLFDQVGVTPSEPEGSSAVLGALEPGESGPLFSLQPQPYHFAATGADFPAEAQRAEEGETLSEISNDQVYAAHSWATGSFPVGTWQLVITDAADLSGGNLESAEILMTPVPEPPGVSVAAAFLLLGAALLSRNFQRPRV